MTVLEAAEIIRQEVEKGGWIYSNSKNSSTFAKALKENNKRIQCARGIQWALKMAGDIKTGYFYGCKGKIVFKEGTKEQLVAKGYKFIKCNKTVNQAMKDGTLKKGDLCIYQDLVHTNLYSGNGYWYDFGHVYTGNSGENVPMKKVYGKTKYGNYKLAWIIRKPTTEVKAKNTEKNDKITYRVQVGVFNTVEARKFREQKIKEKTGLPLFTEKEADGTHLYCGSFSTRANAEERVNLLKKNGFAAVIKEVKS